MNQNNCLVTSIVNLHYMLSWCSLFRNDWKVHNPRSNVMWMDYLTLKLLREKKYDENDVKLYRKFRSFQREILKYDSLNELQHCEFLTSCS